MWGGSDGTSLTSNLKGNSTVKFNLTSFIAEPMKFYGLEDNIKTFYLLDFDRLHLYSLLILIDNSYLTNKR